MVNISFTRDELLGMDRSITYDRFHSVYKSSALKKIRKALQESSPIVKCEMCGWRGKTFKTKCPRCGSKSIWDVR